LTIEWTDEVLQGTTNLRRGHVCTDDEFERAHRQTRPDANATVASGPGFLREGTAI
jgi:hypothetical protein